MKEMVGGCCVCSDERGWTENPLVYCDGQGCNVAVHQACYGIVEVPTGPWFCRKCLSQERNARVKCELCPSKDGALKRTDSSGWAHVVCALYIPEVRFGNVTTMEPIILQLVPNERYNKICYICEDQGKESKASFGACMQCNKSGCKQYFHVTCAQAAGLLCEEAGNYMDNVKYCGYCHYHYQKLKKVSSIKTIPAFKPIPADNATPEPSPEKNSPSRVPETKEKRSRGDRKSKLLHAASNHSSKESTVPLLPPPTLEPSAGNQSDSSTSTSTLSSTNGSNSAEEGKKSLKSIFSSKFSTASFKETATAPSLSISFPPEKTKKKKNDSGSEKNFSDTSKGSPGSKSSTAPTLTFSGMYESFLSTEISSRSEKGENSKSSTDGKRSHHFSEGNERKKSKHSRSKSKSSKATSNHSVIINNQIPIVRIKRNFPHDISSDSHSIDKSGHNSSHRQSSVEKEHNYHWCVIEQPVEEKPPPEKERIETIVRPPEELPPPSPDPPKIVEDEDPPAPVLETNGVICKQEPVTEEVEVAVNRAVIEPMPSIQEKQEPQGIPEPIIMPSVPQTLEELLERQWEQGSNFLMEQAQHFDIASLLNCLHQLRTENQRLENHVKNLASRRDHLLSVNSRLRLPLGSMLSYPTMLPNEHHPHHPVVAAATNGLPTLDEAAANSFIPYGSTLVHSTQGPSYMKSPATGHSPSATVGSSSLPLTPSPVPSSPATRSNPLIQEQCPPTAIYQSISPPFGSPGTSASSNSMVANNHIYQSFQPTMQDEDLDSRGEGDR